MFILFSSVIVMDAFLFLGVLKSSWGKRLFERSFNCFLQFLKYGLWAVGIVIFNCFQKWKFKIMSGLTQQLDISVALGSTGLQTFSHAHPDFLPGFQLNLIQLMMLNTQDSSTVLQVCFHSNKPSVFGLWFHSTKGLRKWFIIWVFGHDAFDGFLENFSLHT